MVTGDGGWWCWSNASKQANSTLSKAAQAPVTCSTTLEHRSIRIHPCREVERRKCAVCSRYRHEQVIPCSLRILDVFMLPITGSSPSPPPPSSSATDTLHDRHLLIAVPIHASLLRRKATSLWSCRGLESLPRPRRW